MIYISIGANLGNRLNNLQTAVRLLKLYGFKIELLSPVLETPAILPSQAPESWNRPYLNMIVGGKTSQSPEQLFLTLQKIEKIVGREPEHPKWAPRVIDLDILLWDDQIINGEYLKIPHPEFLNRPFLIHLMALIAPQQCYPLDRRVFDEIAFNTPVITSSFIRVLTLFPELVGIVNVTPDSFSDGGLYDDPEKAIARVFQLYEEGASIIELGAQSTRPEAKLIGGEAEYQRLAPVLQGLEKAMDQKKLILSLDSFSEKAILKALEKYPFAWVNDQTGKLSEACLKTLVKLDCKIVAMHALTIPANRQHVLAFEKPPIEFLLDWGRNTLKRLEAIGFSSENIVLDPGIGINKTRYQSMALLREIQQLRSLGTKVMVGHSRKPFMKAFTLSPANERDLETIAISSVLANQGVDYLRVHEIACHHRFFVSRTISEHP